MGCHLLLSNEVDKGRNNKLMAIQHHLSRPGSEIYCYSGKKRVRYNLILVTYYRREDCLRMCSGRIIKTLLRIKSEPESGSKSFELHGFLVERDRTRDI